MFQFKKLLYILSLGGLYIQVVATGGQPGLELPQAPMSMSVIAGASTKQGNETYNPLVGAEGQQVIERRLSLAGGILGPNPNYPPVTDNERRLQLESERRINKHNTIKYDALGDRVDRVDGSPSANACGGCCLLVGFVLVQAIWHNLMPHHTHVSNSTGGPIRVISKSFWAHEHVSLLSQNATMTTSSTGSLPKLCVTDPKLKGETCATVEALKYHKHFNVTRHLNGDYNIEHANPRLFFDDDEVSHRSKSQSLYNPPYYLRGSLTNYKKK